MTAVRARIRALALVRTLVGRYALETLCELAGWMVEEGSETKQAIDRELQALETEWDERIARLEAVEGGGSVPREQEAGAAGP